jgi:hypothetical protein
MGRASCTRIWPTLVSACLVSLAAHAESGHPCAAIASDTERLACYDSAFGKPAAATTAGTTPVAAAPAPVAAGAVAAGSTSQPPEPSASPAAGAVAPALEPVETFGYNEAQQRERVPETVKQQPQKLSSIETTLTLLSTRRTGEFVYTLANGQIWIQTEAEQSGYVRDGSAITIKRAALGSYLLVSGSASTRVRRVQ